MIHYDRPACPSGWPPPRVAQAAQAVRDAITMGKDPDFPDHWRSFKPAFEEAQHGKCGFCESKVTAVHTGAVEHHAPKSEIQLMLDYGSEAANSSNLTVSRRVKTLHPRGYWWLAYAWENWLYACDRCNSAWKRCLYPVTASSQAAPEEAVLVATNRLLLHPFDDEPLQHLDFDDQGFISSRDASPLGRATIETCGLDRESVRKERVRVAAEAKRFAERMLRAQVRDDEERVAECAEDLRKIGEDDCPYAGTVRSVVRRVLQIGWEHLP